MDLINNRIQKNVKKIHLIAVCGTAMGALACMLSDLGFAVTGSDKNVYPPMSLFLEKKGIVLFDGFDKKNLEYSPDLVVVGNAVSRDNSEVKAMLEMGIDYCSMPQGVNRFICSGKKRLVVAGTHGKTTTSAILATILHQAGKENEKWDPSFVIGGILKKFGQNYRLGKGEYVVLEGDEYDTAFFDKGAKFFHYAPFLAILLNVEFDHADIFRDLDHVKNTFKVFLSGILKENLLCAFDDDVIIAEIIDSAQCSVERYGEKKNSPWYIADILTDVLDSNSANTPWTFFTVFKKGEIFGNFKTRMLGKHNLINGLAAIAAADKIKIPLHLIQKGIETFEGVKRRQEVRGIKNGVMVMDDFAHHPTAVKETIKAVKPLCPENRLIVVFEPRTNTSMRRIFQDIYPVSFDKADLIYIREPSLLAKIPFSQRFSSRQLVADLKKNQYKACYFENTESIIDHVVSKALPGDIVLVMSNGGFDNIHERLLNAL